MCAVYRGANGLDPPFEVIGTPTTGTADPASLTTITTLSANALVIVPLFGEDNNNGPSPGCTTTGTNPAAYTEHYDETATGADAMVCFSEFERTTAGATGTISVDFDTAVPVGWGAVVLSLQPALVKTIAGPVTFGTTPTVAKVMGRNPALAVTLAATPTLAIPKLHPFAAGVTFGASCAICVDQNSPLNATFRMDPGVVVDKESSGGTPWTRDVAVTFGLTPSLVFVNSLHRSVDITFAAVPTIAVARDLRPSLAATFRLDPQVGMMQNLHLPLAVSMEMNVSVDVVKNGLTKRFMVVIG